VSVLTEEAVSVLSDKALAEYRRDGYVVVDRLLPQSEVEHLRKILLGLHEGKVGFKEGALFDAIGLDDGSEPRFPQITDPRLLAPELKNSKYFEVALAIARQILGETARLRADITFLKPPKIGSDTPWHQDQAFGNPQYDYTQISIWLALTPAGAVNSCMSFVPGSHKLPVLMHQPVGGDPRIHALECIGDFDQSTAVECPLQEGGCTIHDHRTLHYAGPNLSDQSRLAYVLVFDTAPVPRQEPIEFPWRKDRGLTARAVRAQRWYWRGGIILLVWRNRHRLRLDRGLSDLRQLQKAFFRVLKGR
jgi:hypothetical protein